MPNHQTTRHKWDRASAKTITMHDSLDGCEHHLRTCITCGAIKDTILQPDGIWRLEYRTAPDGPVWPERIDCVRVKAVELRDTAA